MLKKAFLILCAIQLACLGIFAQENTFEIDGNFETDYYDGLTVYLSSIDYKKTNEMQALDSTKVEGSKFSFSGTVNKPLEVRYITLQDNDKLSALVLLEPGTIDVTVAEIPTMSGTTKNNELNTFTQEQMVTRDKLEEILEIAQTLHRTGSLDETTGDELEKNFNEQKALMQQGVYEFVADNISNELGEFFFTIYAPNLKVTQLETLYAAANPEFQESFNAKSLINQYVWSLGKLREGQKFEGIELKNIDGATQNISEYIGNGKVVLIDFWASWCGPCVKSMPNLVKLYNEYKESGFEIVGISLDDKESSWTAAVKRLNMEWPQFFDGGGWHGIAAKEYDITRIPQTFLLDKEGKIVGKDLSIVELTKKVQELLEKK